MPTSAAAEAVPARSSSTDTASGELRGISLVDCRSFAGVLCRIDFVGTNGSVLVGAGDAE